MITRILVPTDFSPVADNALLFALNFAQKCKAEVHVLHVNSIPVSDAYFALATYSSIISEMETLAKMSFARLRESYQGTGLSFHEAIATGSVYWEIRNYAEKHNADMIVMGTTGASGLTELLIGSTTASIVSRSDIPVLVVPSGAKYHALKQIVYASDDYEPEFPAVSRLTYLADLFESEVTVLHVKSVYDEYFKVFESFFEKNKEHLAYKKWKLVKTDDPNVMDGINRFIEKEHPDLLVMAKHDLGFFERILHRSLSKKMAYHTKVPLLVLNK